MLRADAAVAAEFTHTQTSPQARQRGETKDRQRQERGGHESKDIIVPGTPPTDVVSNLMCVLSSLGGTGLIGRLTQIAP